MGIQQLDLFATFNTPPAKEEPAKVKQVAAEPEQPIIVTPEPLVEVQPEPVIPIKPAKEESLVFEDEQIAVKIKPKVAVQMPKSQPQQVMVTATRHITAEPIVKLKSKRGRKSYKEIDAELDLIEVPDEETLNQKLYYSITEVAKWFKVNASLLRYWENEFDILKPRKNRKGDRLFRPEDIKNLQVIYYLLRNRKFSLEGAKKYLKNHRQQADVNVQLAQSLTKFRSFLLDLKANLGA